MRRRAVLWAAVFLVSCEAPGSVPRERAVPGWRLVEEEEGGARRLVFEREEAGGIEVRLSRRRAAAGEEVEAEIRLPEGQGRRRLEVRPSRPEVEIRGGREFELEGGRPHRIRFTSHAEGPAGLLILVED